MRTKIRIIISIIIFIAGGFVAWLLLRPEPSPQYSTREARVKSITKMVELCSADIHEEIAIKDSINGKWIVARQTVEGRIRFDLDSLKFEEMGDTMLVYLPKERIDIMEGTAPGDYEVLDSWDGSRLFFQRSMTAAEENAIKRRWQQKVEQRIRESGYVRQARENALKTLRTLFRQLPGVVIVVDGEYVSRDQLRALPDLHN